ncbi:metallopeptidase family protein, partial [uncultured Sphingomonas sp.]|uniref:metallopeptidase family protein n=1 Tax=uncultured Sphingomonas sp. TaxID=158754 RepID=UPI0025DF4ADF
MERQEVLGAAPSADVIEAQARATIARLPEAFRPHLRDVVLLVEEEADAEMLQSVGLDHPLDLTGVYVGRPVGEKSTFESGALPDRIHLYR